MVVKKDKESYLDPYVKIVVFDNCDIITASGNPGDDMDNDGGWSEG